MAYIITLTSRQYFNQGATWHLLILKHGKGAPAQFADCQQNFISQRHYELRIQNL